MKSKVGSNPNFQRLNRNNSAVDCLTSLKFVMWERYVSAEDARASESTHCDIQGGDNLQIFNF